MSLAPQLFVIAVTVLIVVLCVLLHYETLTTLTRILKQVRIEPRSRILLLIFCILLVHVAEIWIFGAAYFGLMQNAAHGTLLANHPMGLLDAVYFSAVCFTTLGLGDVIPMGAMRLLAGTEALCGFVLIAWSGSFTFVEMQRFWKS